MPPILPVPPRLISHRVARLLDPSLPADHHQHLRLPNWTGEPNPLAAHPSCAAHRTPCLSTRWPTKLCHCTHNLLVVTRIFRLHCDSGRSYHLLSDLAPNNRFTRAARLALL
ncbi:unnamed protein product [Chondrus crispus]|uniref:Uncharacterized protein n=1 Tax=Chondrus crispus TaxID=2769 RepID=R7QI55_CHOCR|nr:unnamed protein product [Chondrus crispus]CDF37438.1 unnamed protein product [Chondrus crispus]|eukprot:XP_005717257.1 unnamed protein product [Chondrus crispus]